MIIFYELLSLPGSRNKNFLPLPDIPTFQSGSSGFPPHSFATTCATSFAKASAVRKATAVKESFGVQSQRGTFTLTY